MPAYSNIYLAITSTGSDPRMSHIITAGLAVEENKKLTFKQETLESPAYELALLKKLSEMLKMTGGNIISAISDVKYIKEKCSFYRLNDPFFSRKIIFLEDLLKTDGCAVSDRYAYENVIGFERHSILNGTSFPGEYTEYLLTGRKDIIDELIDHNSDDLKSLAAICRSTAASDPFTSGNIIIDSVTEQDGELCVMFSLADTTVSKEGLSLNGCVNASSAALEYCIQACGNAGKFTCEALHGELKFFFENYKDYYYLPMEGRAVHKSVGQFVDPAFRKRARKETAFEPVTGDFYPEFSSGIRPSFKNAPDDNAAFFRISDVKDNIAFSVLIANAAEQCRKASGWEEK